MDTKRCSPFAVLFKKYRLRSEIETLSEFGDLLAEEGAIYETSLFTRWQKGERVPKNREILLGIIKVFARRGGIKTLKEINSIFTSVGMSNIYNKELQTIPLISATSNSEKELLRLTELLISTSFELMAKVAPQKK